MELADAVRRFGNALEGLAKVDPPAGRAATPHPEIQRLVREFNSAAVIVEKAVDAKFMTATQYGQMAQHFEAIAELMEGGAAKEAVAEKRRPRIGRSKAAPKARKPPARRR
jgi:hypothetical protein